MNLTRRTLQHSQLAEAIGALGSFNAPLDGCIRAVYTRQTPEEWRFCIGQCVLVPGMHDDRVEIYPDFAFVSKPVANITVRELLEAIVGNGFELNPNLPPLRMTASHPNWNEETIPSYATVSKLPARRFTATIENNAFFSEGQLIDYALPYRPSAGRYMKEFLGFTQFHGSADGRKGEFSIEISDRRGAIQLGEGRVSISNPTTDLRLVGEINHVPVDVRNDDAAEIDDKDIRDAELWLLTKDNDVVDYVSTTSWPYKYATTPGQLEQEEHFLELISAGESETCEFKPYIDLGSSKAAEIERTVCAFSNQRGGVLFIGINDEGDIVGLAKEVAKRGEDIDKAVSDYEQHIRKRLRETLKDNQCFTSQVVKVSGTQIVVVDVHQSPEINFLVKSDQAKMAYVRHGATSARLSPPEMKAMLESSAAQLAGRLL